ncbi:hypothetical protein Hanom_Chr05g00451781 [Helianthus anomalus]
MVLHMLYGVYMVLYNIIYSVIIHFSHFLHFEHFLQDPLPLYLYYIIKKSTCDMCHSLAEAVTFDFII